MAPLTPVDLYPDPRPVDPGKGGRMTGGLMPEDKARADMWASVAELLLILPQIVVILFIRALPPEFSWITWFPIATAGGLLLLVIVRTIPSYMIPIRRPPRRRVFKDTTFKF